MDLRPESAVRSVEPRDCMPCWKLLRHGLSSGNHTTISEDFYFEILRFLPVKSLLKFRCVCKAWLQLIDSFAFFNNHMQTQRSKKTVQIFSQFHEPEKYFIYPP